jgi:hypothetical protein
MNKIKKIVTVLGLLVVAVVILVKGVGFYQNYKAYQAQNQIYLYSTSTDRCELTQAEDHVKLLDQVYADRMKRKGEKCNAAGNSKRVMFLECRSDDSVWVASMGQDLCEKNANVVRAIIQENERMKKVSDRLGQDHSKNRPYWLIND